MLLLLYLENQYSIETIGLSIHEVWKQIYKINMCIYLVFGDKFHENESLYISKFPVHILSEI